MYTDIYFLSLYFTLLYLTFLCWVFPFSYVFPVSAEWESAKLCSQHERDKNELKTRLGFICIYFGLSKSFHQPCKYLCNCCNEMFTSIQKPIQCNAVWYVNVNVMHLLLVSCHVMSSHVMLFFVNITQTQQNKTMETYMVGFSLL